MRIFWNKNVKITSVSGASPPDPRFPPAAPPPDPPLISPVYYCKSVGFISSAKCVLFSSKKNKITTVNVLLLLLPQLSHLFFISNSVVFVEGGTRIFLAPERRVP